MELSVKTEHNGAGFILNRAKVLEIFKHFKNQEIELTVRKWKDNRTTRQNRTLHGWAKIVADDTGQDMMTIKEVWKALFLKGAMKDEEGQLMVDHHGEILEFVRPTSSLNIEEFAEFLTQISIWTAEFMNITLPINGE